VNLGGELRSHLRAEKIESETKSGAKNRFWGENLARSCTGNIRRGGGVAGGRGGRHGNLILQRRSF